MHENSHFSEQGFFSDDCIPLGCGYKTNVSEDKKHS